MLEKICPIMAKVCVESCQLYNKEKKGCGIVINNNSETDQYVSTLAIGLTEVKSRLIDLEKEVDLLKKKKSTGK